MVIERTTRQSISEMRQAIIMVMASLEKEKIRGVGYEFLKYFFVSLFALALDLSIFLYLANLTHYVLAATVGFLSGALAHYFLSVFIVFRKRKLHKRKVIELLLFIGSGVGGLIVNIIVIALCVEMFSSPLSVAKIIAAGFSFVFAYLLRKVILF